MDQTTMAWSSRSYPESKHWSAARGYLL